MGDNGRMLDIFQMADLLRNGNGNGYGSSGYGPGAGGGRGYDSGYQDGYLYALRQAGVDTGALGDRFKEWRGNRLDSRIDRLEGKRAELDLPSVRQAPPQLLAQQVASTQLRNAAEQVAENQVFDDYRVFSIIKPQSLAAATQLTASKTPPRMFQMKKIVISTSQSLTLRVDYFNIEGEPLIYGDAGIISDVYGPLTTYRIEFNYITQAVPIEVALTNLSASAGVVSVQVEGFFTPKSPTRRAINN